MEKDYSNLHRNLVLKYFWQVIRNFKISFFTIVFGSIIFVGFDIIIPLQFLKLWNLLSSNNFDFASSAQNIVIIIFILGFIRMGFSYMMGHSHSFFANNFGGSLTQKINKYARAFEKLMDRLVRDGIPLVIRSIGTVIAIYSLVPKYAYILALFCFVFLVTALIYTRLKLKYDVIAARADTKTTGAIADSIGNHFSIQLFTGHNYEKERVGGVIQEQKKAILLNWYLWNGLAAIQAFYVLAIEFVIFWIAIGDWKIGLIGLPVMVLIQSYLGRLMENLWDFAGITRTFYDGFADAQEMALVLDKPYEIIDKSTQIAKNIKGEVVFDNVSLTIPVGQKIAIVGSSGAGKTTFVRLLMRLFNVNFGRIMIDGIDIKNITQENLREQIAFVPQDPVLFHRTLMENIRYGRRDATDEEVLNAAHLSHCDDFIDTLPFGYKTYVGERGVKLSGGERQRVAIARAIIKNAPILILDEATSSLDSHSESLIQDALHTLMKGKTTIVIAHRLSTIREMDRIIVLEKGKIIEDGVHEELA